MRNAIFLTRESLDGKTIMDMRRADKTQWTTTTNVFTITIIVNREFEQQQKGTARYIDERPNYKNAFNDRDRET